jgi:N-acetylneuraminate synthase
MDNPSEAIAIGKRKIGLGHKPFIIAEMSGNHNQSLERALAIVEAAARAGADALKIQTYTPNSMTLDLESNEFIISDPESPWRGRSLFKLYQEAQTPRAWHKPILDRCHELGLIGFSTPFDESAVDFLESLDVPCYKIASFENNYLDLVRKVASTGKPVIMSTGMASLAELEEAVGAARSAGCKELVLLKCTSSYPSTPEHTNLRTLPSLRALFCCEAGLSDHTGGIGAAVASIALGCTVIEKHFTLSRADGGVDSAFSLEPQEMRALVMETERAWQALGKVMYGPTESEEKSLIYRRSLYIARDIEKGEVLTKDCVRCIRPGLGLPPKFLASVLGKRINRDAKKGTPLTWEMIGQD